MDRGILLPSPLGPLVIVAKDHAIHQVIFAESLPATLNPPDGGSTPLLEKARTQLNEYFSGQRQDFDLPLCAEGTPFQKRAWEELRKIAFGETISYGEQSRRLGDPRWARAVGGANGKNPLPILIPCHRVIAGDGGLGGFSAGLENKRFLLNLEQAFIDRPT